jgi:hypothetical protein
MHSIPYAETVSGRTTSYPSHGRAADDVIADACEIWQHGLDPLGGGTDRLEPETGGEEGQPGDGRVSSMALWMMCAMPKTAWWLGAGAPSARVRSHRPASEARLGCSTRQHERRCTKGALGVCLEGCAVYLCTGVCGY